MSEVRNELMINVSEKELTHLIEQSSRDRVVNASWGTGRVQASDWVVAELAKLRGLTADDYEI